MNIFLLTFILLQKELPQEIQNPRTNVWRNDNNDTKRQEPVYCFASALEAAFLGAFLAEVFLVAVFAAAAGLAALEVAFFALAGLFLSDFLAAGLAFFVAVFLLVVLAFLATDPFLVAVVCEDT
jgi:hypothetical protein